MTKQKITWSVKICKIKDLIKNEYNPNELEENGEQDLTNSIKKFGSAVPIIINTGSRKNIIIGGEKRIKIYESLGITKVECMVPSRELTLNEEKELNLRLNKNVGSWNEDLLRDFDMNMLLDVGFGD